VTTESSVPMKLHLTVTGGEERDQSVIDSLAAKAKRRALRHFKGKKVRHRVTRQETNSVEFSFFRRSGKPVRIRVEQIPQQ